MAIKSGARIVSFCGHDCIPWDLIVLKCHQKLKEQGTTMKKVHLWDELKGGISGGTIETMFTLADEAIIGTKKDPS